MRTAATTLAAAALLAIGGAAGAALSAGRAPVSRAAVAPAPVEVRTQVIHRTVHVVRHIKPKRVKRAASPAPRRRWRRHRSGRWPLRRRRAPRARCAPARVPPAPPLAASTSMRVATMTEPRAPRRPRRPGLLAVGGWSLAAFLVVLTLLVVQMRVGRDPALGARSAAAVAPAPRRVLLRRVIVERVVIDVVHDAEDGGAGASGRTVAVVPPGPAPAPAPAAAAAPAPAPAPAPLVTKTS